MLLNWG